MSPEEQRKRIHQAIDAALDEVKPKQDSSYEIKVIVKNGGVADSQIQISRRI
jgi:hypothetical protein